MSIALAVSYLLLVPFAQATDERKANLYIGAGPTLVHASDAKDVCIITFTGRCTVESSSSASIQVFAGMETPGRHLGLELGWVWLGSVEVGLPLEFDRGEVSASTVYGAVKFAYSGGSRFTPFSKIGVHSWKRKVDFVKRISEQQDGVDPMFGVGVDYELRKELMIRIEWTRYAMKVTRQEHRLSGGRSEFFGDDRDTLGIGIVYRF